MVSRFSRALELDVEGNNAFFLWGPRKVGKTDYLRNRFSQALTFDLLQTDLQHKLTLFPSLLRERVLAEKPSLVVLDEIQKVPALLDEVHWCLENTPAKFILCGSSARKLKRGAANLLGGRAWRYEMFPLTTEEIGNADLDRILNHGLIPSHYLSDHPERALEGYLRDYLQEEIAAEALAQKLQTFASFVNAVAATHGQILNYSSLARDCGVTPKTVRHYFSILEDTLLGHSLPAWKKRRKRRLIETARFYLFDVGLVRALNNMRPILSETEEYGRAFEHFLIAETRAFLAYRDRYNTMHYWRTTTGYEVDLILGQMQFAFEFKAVRRVSGKHLKGLRALGQEYSEVKRIVVSVDDEARTTEDGIEIISWQQYCERLWAGDFANGDGARR